MPLTDLQKRTAQAIVNVFETGSPAGDYAAVTVLPGDGGHLTYGRAQTTLASGNLHLLIEAYCAAPDAALADELRPYLPRMRAVDLALDHDLRLHGLLEQAGRDPAMRDVQDAFFDRVFWTPAARAARDLGLVDPLAAAVVYDSKVHGSWTLVRNRVTAERGRPDALGGRAWIDAYVRARRRWLAEHLNRLLRRTVYRMDAFRTLLEARNWALELPITVRGCLIDASVLGGPALRVSAEALDQRALHLSYPPMTGADVEALQRALIARGYGLSADGIFGPRTEGRVREFQVAHGLVADGIAGPATLASLGLA